MGCMPQLLDCWCQADQRIRCRALSATNSVLPHLMGHSIVYGRVRGRTCEDCRGVQRLPGAVLVADAVPAPADEGDRDEVLAGQQLQDQPLHAIWQGCEGYCCQCPWLPVWVIRYCRWALRNCAVILLHSTGRVRQLCQVGLYGRVYQCISAAG